jgi:hypothetical protein
VCPLPIFWQLQDSHWKFGGNHLEGDELIFN